MDVVFVHCLLVGAQMTGRADCTGLTHSELPWVGDVGNIRIFHMHLGTCVAIGTGSAADISFSDLMGRAEDGFIVILVAGEAILADFYIGTRFLIRLGRKGDGWTWKDTANPEEAHSRYGYGY